jgi:hypothetical protein
MMKLTVQPLNPDVWIDRIFLSKSGRVGIRSQTGDVRIRGLKQKKIILLKILLQLKGYIYIYGNIKSAK